MPILTITDVYTPLMTFDTETVVQVMDGGPVYLSYTTDDADADALLMRNEAERYIAGGQGVRFKTVSGTARLYYAPSVGRLDMAGSATGLEVVTPHDTVDLLRIGRGLTCIEGGIARVLAVDGSEGNVVLVPGVCMPVQARRVFQTGTTATGIVSLY